ncbi:MAG: MBL fold metallo-hydrolase [Acidimicrobiia bacterium]|nr:MBL fold metallo-hydrolase [Acidimicrobiia bacterium]
MPGERLYFRQLLAGRDFARDDPAARSMANFSYLVGDRETGEALVVDPAYRVADLVAIAAADGFRITGVLATHHHPDHVGGAALGWPIEGVAELLAHPDFAGRVHVQRAEADGLRRVTGASASDLVLHDAGDVVEIGSVAVTLIHTPGHTPGSQCFLVDGRLVSGDTLFLDGCGRTDLPGGDPVAMYESLTGRLAHLPDDTVVFPGHLYSPDPSATLGETRRTNYVFRPRDLEGWLMMFGRA